MFYDPLFYLLAKLKKYVFLNSTLWWPRSAIVKFKNKN